SVTFCQIETLALTPGPTAIQANTHTTASMTPKKTTARVTPRGRQVCGSTGAGGPGTRAGSETAGMDVGDQDPSRPDLPQLVHDPVGAQARHHRPHGHPPGPMQRRHGGTL